MEGLPDGFPGESLLCPLAFWDGSQLRHQSWSPCHQECRLSVSVYKDDRGGIPLYKVRMAWMGETRSKIRGSQLLQLAKGPGTQL